MVPVRFVNKSGERVILYQEDGSILKILENGKCWDRDPASGTLRTKVISQHEIPPPSQTEPYWIDKVEWLYEKCPDRSPYAPYKTIIFLDGNKVKLKRRLFWKNPELAWPVVKFLFKSQKMKLIRERLDRDSSVLASIFLNGIPVRKSVNPLSKYAEFKNWIFSEQPIQDSNPSKQIKCSSIVQYGENERPPNELARIDELKEAEKRSRLV